MRIIVPIKQMLDPSGLIFRRDKERMFVNREDYVIDPGSKAAVEKACEMLKAQGAKRALPLPVSVPSHSALMKPAAEQCRAYLEKVALRAPAIPVLQNADVQAFSGPAAIIFIQGGENGAQSVL